MFDKSVPVITLDGPSGTGKGTLCHLLANHLHWHMLDSGAIYRVLALAARQCEISVNDINKLIKLALSLDLRFESTEDNESRIFLDNVDVTQAIRSEQCGQDASIIAIIPEVRQALLERQRNFAKAPGLVTDGRDMGTVVFPDALLKIFLYASAEERANRRFLQLQANGNNVSLAQVVEELHKRDTRDVARACSPLIPAADAIQVDTTGLTIVQVLQNVLQLVDKHIKNA
ncbi:MAG: (d)CMP kinase [Legionella sp.]|jgi:cytidylate kinase